MIIGYYHQIFFGGGTYFKLSKRDNEDKYKFEFCHSAIPNYIPNAEEYIKKYDTLTINNERICSKIEITEKYIDYNQYIKEIIKIIHTAEWNKISKTNYSNNNLDDVNWCFYIRDEEDLEYIITGYAVYPKEVEQIYYLFKKIKELL